MKKSFGIFVGACLVAGFAATVHAAVNGAQWGAVATIYGGGTGTNPNPEFTGNCTAYLQLWPAEGNEQHIIQWMTVAAPTPAACSALVSAYVNDPNTNWKVNLNLPLCACASPSMGRVLELSDASPSWTLEQEQSLEAELQDLRQEYRVNEYYEQVRLLVEERIQ
ncbi:hypothetical protein HI113_17360 [Corallococcus exiguus]|uniref:hypothetical protein n=1 Tax=Corallococcus TaxID=83461 RepID=UPI000EEC63AD|nr:MULTISPECIES: hypothetical protein [Corallococcus]NNB95666.1 hypothetical protein [Corallococcus exiguus]NPC47940.1 hypothetical protein [Corallococcus exiguus]RKH79053.1 hypothetical protein D7X99_26285 [Corallococcus sp. AB032C]